MSTQHTPTPWEIVWERDTDHNPPKRAQSIGPVSADHDHWSGWTICDEADAEFIVRACNSHDDLLAALKEVVSNCAVWQSGESDMSAGDFLSLIEELAYATIEKAEGKKRMLHQIGCAAWFFPGSCNKGCAAIAKAEEGRRGC